MIVGESWSCILLSELRFRPILCIFLRCLAWHGTGEIAHALLLCFTFHVLTCSFVCSSSVPVGCTRDEDYNLALVVTLYSTCGVSHTPTSSTHRCLPCCGCGLVIGVLTSCCLFVRFSPLLPPPSTSRISLVFYYHF